MQFYTDPTRESDPHALPDAETYYHPPGPSIDKEPGWYWWPCFPGSDPTTTRDSRVVGPFPTEAEAIQDAQES